MKDETSPVSPDELVVRLIWKDFYKPDQEPPLSGSSFLPRPDETEGFSVFRLACLGDPTDALLAMAPEKRDRYAIAVISVADLLALGLSVKPAKIDAIPGHAVIPELNPAAVKGDRKWWKGLQMKLTELAAKNLTPPAEPKT
jgi:hypothetical protein